MKLVMTLLVRDENDVIGPNIDFHLHQGVDFFIVTDNASVDRTPYIVKEYEKRGLAQLIHEPDDTYAQSRWVTRMARIAARDYGADWVINNDADEFWLPTEHEGLKEALSELPLQYGTVVAHRKNFVPPRREGGEFYEKMIVHEAFSTNPLGDRLPPKVCHRAYEGITVAQGNHRVSGLSEESFADDGRIEILHFPLRSYEQFQNKIIKGGRAYERNTELPPNVGRTWRDLYRVWQEGGLERYYNAKTLSRLDVWKGLMRGSLSYDTRLRDTLRMLYAEHAH